MADLYALRFGVNYTPTRGWWYCWNDFQPEAIARDLDAIAALEADHIRIMLIWPYFQPNAAVVSEAHLERLGALMELARARKLDVCASLFVGWLSGYRFTPPYQKDQTFYSLGETLAAQELYLERVAAVLREYPNTLGIDLGNELNCCWQAELSQGDRWQDHMLARAAEFLPDGVHVNGVDHNPWFTPATFSPANLARKQQIATLHCWTYFTGALQQTGGDIFAPASIQLPATMAALARAYAGDAAKPVWVQEFGMSESWSTPQHIHRFLEETTAHAIKHGVSWFTWWCSHDLDRALAFDPLEYSLGLITHDQRLKPQGEAFRTLARAYRGKRIDPTRLPALRHPPAEHTPEVTWEWLKAAAAGQA